MGVKKKGKQLQKKLSNNIIIQSLENQNDLINAIKSIYKSLKSGLECNLNLKLKNNMTVMSHYDGNEKFEFQIRLTSNKIPHDKILSSFYDLLYLFFVNVHIIDIISDDQNKKIVDYSIINIVLKFEFHNEKELDDIYYYSIKEIFTILKRIEKKRQEKEEKKKEKEELKKQLLEEEDKII